jgi:hypothetical protein
MGVAFFMDEHVPFCNGHQHHWHIEQSAGSVVKLVNGVDGDGKMLLDEGNSR